MPKIGDEGRLDRLSINQYTTREKWGLREAVEGYARHGVHSISVTRNTLVEVGLSESRRLLDDNSMRVSGYCIGGLLTDTDNSAFQRMIDENKEIIDEAARIKAACIVFVAGGLPEGSKDIDGARERCLEGIEAIRPHAEKAGVVIGLEPLHPMTCSLRSCLTSVSQALDWCDQLGGGPALGVVLDVYHVWWDADLAKQIERASGRIVAFHVSDWLTDTQDLRVDRGMMGDGVIEIPRIRALVERAGYEGDIEVEIFSSRNWWKRDPDEVVEIVKERFEQFV